MRGLLFAILAAWSASGAAQTMYKCTNAQGRITYSNEICEKQGLKDAGKVADRVTTMPFTEPSKPAARVDAAKATPRSKDDEEAGRGGGGTQIKPVVPLLEKLLK